MSIATQRKTTEPSSHQKGKLELLSQPPGPRARKGALGTVSGPVGRTLYALPFIFFGLNHLMQAEQMAGMVPGWIPGSTFWVYLTGLAMICAALAILFRRFVVPAAMGLALMLGVFVLTIHLPGVLAGQDIAASFSGLLKDTALAGGALMSIRALGTDS